MAVIVGGHGGRTRGVRRRWVIASALAVAAAWTVGASPAGQAPAASGEYVALPFASRLVDTRPDGVTSDGAQEALGVLPAGSTLDVPVVDRIDVPVGAESVVLVVTAVDPLGVGFLTVHPTGTARPNASSVNYYEDHNTANTVIARLGGGSVSIYTSAAIHLVVDAFGYWPVGGYAPIDAPARLVDTRPGATTVDGAQAGTGIRVAGSTLEVPVPGRAGVPIGAGSVVLTVTAVDPLDAGFLTVHPTGTARPNASSVNYYAGHNMANTVVAGTGVDGSVSVYASAATHLVVDVAGWFPNGGYVALPGPVRLADTRPGGVTTDGMHAGEGAIARGNALQLAVAGRAGLPTDASTAVLNVTAVDPAAAGFLTVHPTGTDRPGTSNLNYYAAHNTANTVLARIGAGGDVCVFTHADSHLVVDVSGYLTGPAPPAAGPTCPDREPVLAVWPDSNTLFLDPVEAAEDFLREVFHVEPVLGEFMQADRRSGEVEVLWPGDDEDPSTVFPTGSGLALERLGTDWGWFVTSAGSDGVSITSPEPRVVVPAGPLTVQGVGRGHEATVVAWAFPAGGDGVLDTDSATTSWSVPTPYTMSLDLSGAEAGQVVAIVVAAATPYVNDPAEFAAIPVMIAA